MREADLEMAFQQPRSTVLHNQWTGRQSQSPSMSLLELWDQVPQREGRAKTFNETRAIHGVRISNACVEVRTSYIIIP